MDFPWYGYLVIVGVMAWAAIVIVATVTKNRSRNGDAAAAAVEHNNVVNQAVLSKLESIESRLGAIEKTLTDIP